ncbi:MAG: FtsW/RodA/SpoVE family cell cycle protein [Chloroflexota bacterium]
MNANHAQTRLLIYAAAFLFSFSLALTFSPVVRERTWEVDLRWTHWIGLAVWAVAFALVHRWTSRRLPEADPFLLPVASLLTGWGALTVFRLDADFGLRQTAWLVVALAAFILVLRFPSNLSLLRKYKYVSLLAGILLTALTLVFGTNPAGYGPRLWLGAMGIYLQPSEPLKLLLIIYLTAYIADRLPSETKARSFLSFPLLVPTLAMTGLSLVILVVQRDLGTASIFLVLYTLILFLATGKRRVLLLTAFALASAALIGYFFVDIIRLRLTAWLDPWADPSGQSYQIVQSLLAIANGGVLGRGPGLGSPTLVPVALSDFIFSAIAEETGLIGVTALLALLGLLLARGLRAALHATDRFQRLLASGITAYFGAQSLLILGGNLRLLPLTGVTLPFVSYGGSSLVTSFLALAILLRVSHTEEEEPAFLPDSRPYSNLAALCALGLFACALATGWWALARGPDLLTRTDNARRSIADRYVPRGDILDRQNRPITITLGERPYTRAYTYPNLAPITGYTHPTYGQAGIERALDGYLRGLQGNPSRLLLWNNLLYGTPPPGLDLRLSIDLDLQRVADSLLSGHKGAAVLLNARTGEILAMASRPAYDPNLLDEIGDALLTDPNAPLVNRAAQGAYPLGSSLDPFLAALFGADSAPEPHALVALFTNLGFYSAPRLYLPTGDPSPPGALADLRVSPLQMALAMATLSADGVHPAPRIVLAVDTPAQGWVILPTLPQEFLPRRLVEANRIAETLAEPESPYWRLSGTASEKGQILCWYISGTLPGWRGAPLTVVVLLEEDNPSLAQQAGEELLQPK